MLIPELNLTVSIHGVFFFRRRPAEHQRCRSDPADLQRGRFCAEGSDSSVPGGAPRHPDSLWRLRGGHRVCQQGRPGPFRRTQRRHPQLDATVDSLAGVTKVDPVHFQLKSLPPLQVYSVNFHVKDTLWLCFCCFSHMHWCRDIVLQKTNNESWGFSIVGGYEESHGQQPFFIKTIVPGTPAHFDGRLK